MTFACKARRVLSLAPALVIVVVALEGTTVWADSPDSWLAKFESAMSRAYSARFQAVLNVKTGQERIAMTMDGRVEQADSTRVRSEVAMQTRMPNGPEVEANVVSVADGTAIWAEIRGGGIEGVQVVKMDLPDPEDAAGALGGGAATAGLNPVQQLRGITSLVTFSSAEIGEGRVTLTGGVDPESMDEDRRKKLSKPLIEKLSWVQLVLDADSGAPVRLIIGEGEQPFMKISVSDYRALESVKGARFAYSPPPGAEVADLTENGP